MTSTQAYMKAQFLVEDCSLAQLSLMVEVPYITSTMTSFIESITLVIGLMAIDMAKEKHISEMEVCTQVIIYWV